MTDVPDLVSRDGHPIGGGIPRQPPRTREHERGGHRQNDLAHDASCPLFGITERYDRIWHQKKRNLMRGRSMAAFKAIITDGQKIGLRSLM